MKLYPPNTIVHGVPELRQVRRGAPNHIPGTGREARRVPLPGLLWEGVGGAARKRHDLCEV